MRLLLDTHTVLWLAGEPERLPAPTLERLVTEGTELVLSAVVAWEIAIKWRSGKLTLPDHPRGFIRVLARELGTVALPVTQTHVLEVADLPDHHHDPFDRLLIAQALVERHPVVTADEVFGRYGVEVVPAR